MAFKQTVIDKLTHENAVLKRLKFAAKSEACTVVQKSLIEETLDMDLAVVAAEIEALQPTSKPADDKKQPKRAPLPAHLPRREVRHEPENTTCGCGTPMRRIGEDVAEKLDYQPGVFTVERHIRGKWVCGCCEKLVQAPVAPHVIDKGLPTTGLLAQVLVAKYLDHLPLYREEGIFERAGHAIARSTLAQWVGECGTQLQPLVDALAADDAQLEAWVAGQLGDMAHLPRDLADADPALLTPEAMRAALADAEASVLAQLSDLADLAEAADGARAP